MSAITLVADTKGIEERLARAARPIDLRVAFEQLVELFREREVAQFEAAPWKPLSKRYAARKAEEYPGQGTLRRTGALYAALTKPAVAELFPDHAVIGLRTGVGRSDQYYAQFHQEGRGVPKRTLVRRFSRDERDDWADVIRVEALRQVLS